MAIVIGLDTGTSATKAVAVDESGGVLASASVEYPLLTPRPDWAEQNPSDWKKAAYEALRELTSLDQVRPSEVRAIGLTGQMHGSVFLDSEDEVLRPALLWCDQRTQDQCDEITHKVGSERLIEMVANPALTGFTAPKILWLREHEPQIYDRVRKVLLPKDYVRLALTGEKATDVADASGTLLFDIEGRCWHRELLSLLEIPSDWMPRAFEGPEITGELSSHAAEATGLPKGIPVVAGGGDQAAGAVGCGIVETGIVSTSLGTSGVVFAFSDEISRDPKGRVHTFCHAIPGKWHVMGVMLSAGGALRWFRDTFCRDLIERAGREGVDPYEYIIDEAEHVPAGAEGLTFLPYLTGERTPHLDPRARGAFIGLSPRHDRGHMARAVLEGVTYGMRDGMEIMREMRIPMTRVRASGGGARSAFWRQLQADIYGLPVVRINVEEGPAYGAALLSTLAAGLHASVEEACASTIRSLEVLEPGADAARGYQARYPLFKKAYAALAEHFSEAHALL